MHVLVSAASKHDATAEIADALAATLRARGFEVTVVEPGEVGDLQGVDALVLGSAVYAGHWLPEAKDLAQRLAPEVRDMPVWLFSSGPVGEPAKPDGDPVDVAELVETLGVVEHRVFTGRLDRSRLGFAERAIVTALRAPVGDFRDWDAIAAWAVHLARALEQGQPAPV